MSRPSSPQYLTQEEAEFLQHDATAAAGPSHPKFRRVLPRKRLPQLRKTMPSPPPPRRQTPSPHSDSEGQHSHQYRPPPKNAGSPTPSPPPTFQQIGHLLLQRTWHDLSLQSGIPFPMPLQLPTSSETEGDPSSATPSSQYNILDTCISSNAFEQ